MLDYWEASGLVKVMQLDASLAEKLQGKSSAEDWNKRGVKVMCRTLLGYSLLFSTLYYLDSRG